MPRTLDPLPPYAKIVDRLTGEITDFFRLRWAQLQEAFFQAPTIETAEDSGLTAAVSTTTVFTVLTNGLYRVSYYLRKTVADGVSSSLTFTWGWTENGTPLTEADAALTTDTASAQKSNQKLFYADASSNITFAIAYASNTPATMTYRYYVTVEQLQ